MEHHDQKQLCSKRFISPYIYSLSSKEFGAGTKAGGRGNAAYWLGPHELFSLMVSNTTSNPGGLLTMD